MQVSNFMAVLSTIRYQRKQHRIAAIIKDSYMTSLSQKIDGTEYLRGSTDLAIFFILLNLEAWNLAGVNKIENKKHFVHVKFFILGLEMPKT